MKRVAIIGGATDPDAFDLSDGPLFDIVTGDLKSILNLAVPDMPPAHGRRCFDLWNFASRPSAGGHD